MSNNPGNRDNQQGQIDVIDIEKFNSLPSQEQKINTLARYIKNIQNYINKPSETTNEQPKICKNCHEYLNISGGCDNCGETN